MSPVTEDHHLGGCDHLKDGLWLQVTCLEGGRSKQALLFWLYTMTDDQLTTSDDPLGRVRL